MEKSDFSQLLTSLVWLAEALQGKTLGMSKKGEPPQSNRSIAINAVVIARSKIMDQMNIRSMYPEEEIRLVRKANIDNWQQSVLVAAIEVVPDAGRKSKSDQEVIALLGNAIWDFVDEHREDPFCARVIEVYPNRPS